MVAIVLVFKGTFILLSIKKIGGTVVNNQLMMLETRVQIASMKLRDICSLEGKL